MNHGKIALAAACAAAWIGSATLGAADAQAAAPKQQQAMVQTGTGGPQVLKLQTIPVLEPGSGQVLIRVYAAAVNPADWGGLVRPAPAGTTIRRVPGIDAAGVIAAVGPGVTDRPVGTPVFAIIGADAAGPNGAYAHYVIAAAANTAPKPANLSYVQAAGLGVVGVTALGALDEAHVQAGQRVLITGVAGGVGSTTAQMAVARGATVLGTASPRHDAYLHGIGVKQVIDYTRGDIAGQAGKVDAVIDTVGRMEAVEALHAVKAGGHFVSIARAPVTPAECAAAQVQCSGSPGHAAEAPLARLLQVGKLAGDGKLAIHIDRTYPLAQAAEAVQYVHQGHTEGKVVLTVGGPRGSRGR
jgi:NADPH:quinone reductase-like Zn-dependent oxidoreductase